MTNKYAAAHAFSPNYPLMRRLEQDRLSHPDNLDLTGHTVDPRIFPVEALQAASRKMLAAMGPEALQYSASDDYMPLKAQIAARYTDFGLPVRDANFVITNGSTQALDILFKSYVDEGDLVLVSAPTEPRVLEVMAMYGPRIESLPMRDSAPDLDALALIMAERKPRVIYVMPDFGGPEGSWSLETRQALGRLVNGTDCLLIEHDFYGELTADGQHRPFVCQYAGINGVVVGSFSQIIAPGVRCGWICAVDEAEARVLTGTKQKTDSHTNGYMQRVLWQYLADGDFGAQADLARTLYRSKRETLCSLLTERLPGDVRFSDPGGGVNLWLLLPEEKDAMAVYEAALAQGLTLSPASAFYWAAPTLNALRLCFAGVPEDRLEELADRLVQLLN